MSLREPLEVTSTPCGNVNVGLSWDGLCGLAVLSSTCLYYRQTQPRLTIRQLHSQIFLTMPQMGTNRLGIAERATTEITDRHRNSHALSEWGQRAGDLLSRRPLTYQALAVIVIGIVEVLVFESAINCFTSLLQDLLQFIDALLEFLT